ncbi:putative toxin-antitoxin system toxin component, PIN family [uncultured Prevotella sp.]|uniref:putative toxin-antitoxin system toxin component, PIN family n=1 Tax=uncultured Prevotella sp. TaxID=159272 RepID=UPI002636A4D1|nr:putative toxin-antitoxin system toxin component, PIN family [uncultured Prevotella sp.]
MGRLVLDTNCLIQIVSPRSKYHSLWMSFVRGEYELCVSNEIVDEYLEILQKLTSVEVAEYIMKTIINSPFVVFIDPFYKFDLIQADKDDNKFVDCAIAAQARCIISNDHHYDILSTIPFPHVEVIKLTDFMEIMKASGN